MKVLILNEIYSASLLYHLFLSCYIFKYVVIIDGEWGGYEESPSKWGILARDPASIYVGMGTVNQSPAPSHPITIPTR